MRNVVSVWFVALAMVFLGWLGPAIGGDAEKPKPCTTPEYSQFDFWVGEWSVADAKGKVVGSNTIKKILDGCGLEESWTGAAGMRGHSFNIYAKERGKWHQTWIDTNGMLLTLDGGLDGPNMILSGKTPSRDRQSEVLHEISWNPLEDGRVRQTWRTSKDGGASWEEVFVGFYTRVD